MDCANGSNTLFTASSPLVTRLNNSSDLTFVPGTTVPVAPPAPPAPIPTMSAWGLGILAGLLGLMGFVRRRKV